MILLNDSTIDDNSDTNILKYIRLNIYAILMKTLLNIATDEDP